MTRSRSPLLLFAAFVMTAATAAIGYDLHWTPRLAVYAALFACGVWLAVDVIGDERRDQRWKADDLARLPRETLVHIVDRLDPCPVTRCGRRVEAEWYWVRTAPADRSQLCGACFDLFVVEADR